MFTEAGGDVGPRRLTRCGTGIHDQVDSGQFPPGGSKVFPDKTLHPIALHRVADCFHADCQSQSRAPLIIRYGQHPEQGIRGSRPAAVDSVELGFLGETASPRQPVGGRPRCGSCLPGVQADRRLRPLARRLRTMARPLFVAMRARKPWVLLRWRLLG